MFRSFFDRRPVVENCNRISAGAFTRHYYLEFKQPDFSEENSVNEFIEKIEKEGMVNLTCEINGKVEYTEKNPVKLTYTKSNLGKGFIFWFICNICGRRVKYLYFPPSSQVAACRKCHKLAYSVQNENKRFRDFNRFLK